MKEKPFGFELLEHPADLGIEAWGWGLAEAFEQAAAGLMSIILDLSAVASAETRQVSLEGGDYGHLLVKWLQEVLYLYDGGHFVGKEFRIRCLSPFQLVAQVRGEAFSTERHETRLDVKAVTYHQLEVYEGEKQSWVRVYLDI